MSDKVKDIRRNFDAFMEKVKSDPASRADILKEASNEIEEALKGETAPELVHLAVDEIYPRMGSLGMEKRILLLRNYMKDAPDEPKRRKGSRNPARFYQRR